MSRENNICKGPEVYVRGEYGDCGKISWTGPGGLRRKMILDEAGE